VREGDIQLGRIAGIRISVNWSWLIVFALIVWTLAGNVFPDQNPGLGDGTYAAMAVVGAALFFLSLLLHELGHALQARRDGMEIDGITLWLFGGVARFRGMFPSAGAELRIALAGPLVSLLLGLGFAGLAGAVPMPEAVDGVAAWLGYTNLVLLVFNLVPALPLDGGRVLRATLWLVRGDFAWATIVAAGIARAIAYLMIGGGLALLLFVGALGGAWLAFIGWFLLQAAAGEARYLATREALGDLRVRDLMQPDPVTVPADVSVGRFMDDVAWSRRYTTYPVVVDGRPIGLVSFRCVASVPRSEWDTRSIRECMIPLDEVPNLRLDEEAIDALAELASSDVNRGLVVEDDRLVGLLSISDLARAMAVRPLRGRRR
jgi:Zn-dependent protease/predicted transcriptional regulator